MHLFSTNGRRIFETNVYCYSIVSSRNDRRVRYLTDMFNSFFPSRPKNVTLDTTLNNTMQSKLDLSTTHTEEKLTKMNDYDEKYPVTPKSKHVNINERRENQEKQIFIDNLKTCPSPYSSYRCSENKFNAKEQMNLNSNIYSDDPLHSSHKPENNSIHYEYVDLNQGTPASASNEEIKPEEVIYDVINTTNERPVHEDIDDMYATPKHV